MHRRGGPDGELIVAATDLVGFLECGHLTNLEMQAVAGLIHKPPQREDPEVQLLQRRGHAHEARYIEHLRAGGREVVEADSDWDHSFEDRAKATEELMRTGADVIYQATVFDGRWLGFPDFLLRKGGPPPPVSRIYGIRRRASKPETVAEGSEIARGDSDRMEQAESPTGGLGTDWHYEVADTKLAHVAKASALIQIASYVEQIERIQGVRPEKVYVVTGGKRSGGARLPDGRDDGLLPPRQAALRGRLGQGRRPDGHLSGSGRALRRVQVVRRLLLATMAAGRCPAARRGHQPRAAPDADDPQRRDTRRRSQD